MQRIPYSFAKGGLTARERTACARAAAAGEASIIIDGTIIVLRETT